MNPNSAKQQVESMLQSGKITQQQFEKAKEIATSLLR
jgi:hypothetical protein